MGAGAAGSKAAAAAHAVEGGGPRREIMLATDPFCRAQELVAAKLPKLHRQLAELGCDMTILATDWFLCLYATSLPCEARWAPRFPS